MLLLAVKSCQRDLEAGHHKTIRETWGQDLPDVDLRFFVGRGAPHMMDELSVDVPDDYDSLPVKTRAILNWSSTTGRYDHVFLCDTDTFLIPRKLMACGFQNWDYCGRFGKSPAVGTTFSTRDARGNAIEQCHPWASGGLGYFLSRKAAAIVAEAEPMSWAEDLSVGQILGPRIQSGEITATDIDGFDAGISWHYPAHRLGWDKDAKVPLWMKKMYEEHR
jgi:hypothetical protein